MEICNYKAEIAKDFSFITGINDSEIKIWAWRILCDTHGVVVVTDQAYSRDQATQWSLSEKDEWTGSKCVQQYVASDNWEVIDE